MSINPRPYHGIGISEASQKTLFDAFTQGDQSTTKRYGGSGLGLALCAQLANLMGGSIEVSSEPNKGSVFSVQLPLKLAADTAPVAGPNEQLQLTQHPWILLVDDNLINRKVGTRLIESLGCSVMLAENGRQAIKACEENDFSVVLMDIQMPEMDGVEAMHAIRALNKPCPPIVALTAYASVGDREHFLNAGFDDYLEKPLKKKRLWEALVSCSEDSSQAAENPMLEKAKQAPILNGKAYEEFIELMAEEAEGLIERFQKDIVEACKEIAALAKQAPDDCRQTAHRLKSSSGYIGAERMRGLFEWLELEMANADTQQQQDAIAFAQETAEATVLALQKASA